MRLITKKMDHRQLIANIQNKQPNDGDDFNENNDDGGSFKV